MTFKPPTAAERLKAIGPTAGLPQTLKKALEPGEHFDPMPAPRPGDWLAEHQETGQTFGQFCKSRPNKPNKNRNKIYIQPLGQFPKTNSQLLDTLGQYTLAYFSMPVELLAPLSIADKKITTRTNQHTRKRQLLTPDILEILRKKLPSDAFCLLAITAEDLYPDPSWNFVFGQASLRDRVGVYSFARYDPAFYGIERDKNYEQLLLRRSCKVLAHETAHMFGLPHCIYFKCIANGSNHLNESDARPMHVCPVCLRKLQYSIGFDVVDRYVSLFRFYKREGFSGESKWIADRLEHILGPDEAQAMIGQKRRAK